MTMLDRGIKELELAGLFEANSEYGGRVGDLVKKLLEVVNNHESGSAAIVTAVETFNRLVHGDVLTPITATPSDWDCISDGIWQNLRSPSTFSYDGGKSWYNVEDCLYTARRGNTLYKTHSLNCIDDPRDIVDWPKCNTCMIRKTCDERRMVDEEE